MFAKQLFDKCFQNNYLIKKIFAKLFDKEMFTKKLFDKDSMQNSQNSVTKQMDPRKKHTKHLNKYFKDIEMAKST